jgi:hypothetical protein
MATAFVLARRGPVPVGKLFGYLAQILLGTAPSSNGTAPALNVSVRCSKCGEIITVRVDKANDLLAEYADEASDSEEMPHPIGYTLYKEVVGRSCPNLVHFVMQFDAHRRVTKHRIEGGTFVGWQDTR